MYKGSTNQEAGDSMVNPGRKLKKMILILGITGAVYAGFQYLLPLVIPFLLAYGVALWLRPSVRYLERIFTWKIFGRRIGIPAAVIGGGELVLIFATVILFLYVCGNRLLLQVEQFVTMLPQWLVWLDQKLTGICRGLEAVLGLKADYLVILVRDMIRELGEILRQSSMPVIMSNSMTVFTWLAEALIFCIIFFISVLMFLQEMDEIRERKNRSMFHREFALIGKRLVNVGSAWLRAEAVIVFVTSVLCIGGLFLIGNVYALLLGIGIGLLDALPFFGAGIVLIPWGVVYLAQKQWKKGMILLGLYVVCYLLRQILEARLMGNQVGLTSMETLISMFVGLKLFGLPGFLLGPIGLLLIKDLVELYWSDDGTHWEMD